MCFQALSPDQISIKCITYLLYNLYPELKSPLRFKRQELAASVRFNYKGTTNFQLGSLLSHGFNERLSLNRNSFHSSSFFVVMRLPFMMENVRGTDTSRIMLS